MPTNDFVKTLAGDLLNLDVSTIIRENTTNSKMPSVRRMAIMQIADSYRSKMVEIGVAVRATDEATAAPKGEHAPFLLRWRFAGEWSFVEINNAAKHGVPLLRARQKAAEDAKDKQRIEERINLLTRFQAQSSSMIGMYKTRRRLYADEIKAKKEDFSTERPPKDGVAPYASHTASQGWNNDISIRDINETDDMELSPDNLTLVRKTWEIGSQRVYLQTVVQIDGDVTSYITRDFIKLPENVKSLVLNIHNDSVASSTKMWTMLFNTVANIAGQALGSMFGGGGKK